MSEQEMPLASEFAAGTREHWLKLVADVVKSADVEQRLSSRTADGLIIRPLATRADRRGAAPPLTGTRRARWDVRQRHAEPDPELANAAIREDLAGGVGSLLLQVESPGQAGIGYGRPALERALSGIPLDGCAIALDARENTLDAAGSLLALWREAGIGEEQRTGFFNVDPLGVLAQTGTLYYPPERACAIAAKFTADYRTSPRLRTLLADARPYHEAGASEAQELACMLATVVAYLRACEAEGLPPQATFAKLALALAADADLFLTIAKLRAARRMAGRIAEACGAERAIHTLHIGVTTSERMLARRDPWVNILRAAVACTAAAVGGADAITVLPFTWVLGKPDALARRIARNTQIVLQEESALARVADPAAGAYSLEALTDTLAEAGWKLFQEIEAKGGMARALQTGFIQQAIAGVAAVRASDIAHGRSPLTGVSAFAQLGEDRLEVVPHPPAPPIVRGGTDVAPLARQRLAEPFERLRDAADAWQQRTGKRPQVFLAALGTPAMHSARITWMTNFLAAGGIAALPSAGCNSAEEAGRAFAESGARIACICSSDRLYAELAPAAAHALKAAGACKVVLAGRPTAQEPALRAAGVDAMIAAGCDAPRILGELHQWLGISPEGS